MDASAIGEILLAGPAAPQLWERLGRSWAELHAPHLLDIELLHLLRRYSFAGRLDPKAAAAGLAELAALPLRRHAHYPHLARIWSLRHNLTAYDATYVALAEALQCPLLTRDCKMAASSGHAVRFEVI